MGRTAKTKTSGERGLPWKTPDWTGESAVCQPLKATLTVVPACRMLIHCLLRSPCEVHCCYPSLHPGPVQPVEGLLELHEEKDAWLLAACCQHAWYLACGKSWPLGREGSMIGGQIVPTHAMAKQLALSQNVLWTGQMPCALSVCQNC